MARQPRQNGPGQIVHVLPKPGVTDPEGASALELLRDLGYAVSNVRTIRTYRVEGPEASLPRLIERVLANSAVEMTVRGTLTLDRLDPGQSYRFRRVSVPIRDLNDAALLHLSRSGQLALSLSEMKAIERHFTLLGREPTDCELETLAQTWSEHCSHKTLKGRISFRGKTIENLLKQTIFKATNDLGCDWLVSVFSDNAGVVRFDQEHDVCFKVETHNHPSAIDPYGGANTGLGGVIRDALGTGLTPADLQHRRLLRGPARLADGPGSFRRASSQARAERCGRRGARLRQSNGHSHRQRSTGGRPGLSRQSPGVLRNGRSPAARQGF